MTCYTADVPDGGQECQPASPTGECAQERQPTPPHQFEPFDVTRGDSPLPSPDEEREKSHAQANPPPGEGNEQVS